MFNFRKKPIIIQARRLDDAVDIKTPEGTMRGNPGDWLIRGTAGEEYLCKDDIFRRIYEAADEAAASELCRPAGRKRKLEVDR